MVITLRAATLEDAEILFAWRNDEGTRAASHNTEPVQWSAHLDWLRRSLAMPQRRLYVALLDTFPVGTARLDLDDAGVTALSWTVAPTHRGRGIGRALVRAAVALRSGAMRAEIKSGNVASQHIAEAAGFRFEREIDGVLHYARHF